MDIFNIAAQQARDNAARLQDEPENLYSEGYADGRKGAEIHNLDAIACAQYLMKARVAATDAQWRDIPEHVRRALEVAVEMARRVL